jgi:ABC-type glycerol-3-phosphate transport system permease component
VHGKNYEFALTIAALVITVFLLFLAAYITRRESYVGQAFIIILYFAGMAYFIFKLVRMYDSSMADQYLPARHSLTTFAVLTILLLIVTIVTAVLCMMNFNKGLKPHVQRRKGAATVDDTKYANYPTNDYTGPGQHQLENVGSRMTID